MVIRIGDAVPDLNFYHAVLRIWLGDRPVDRSLKPALPGDALTRASINKNAAPGKRTPRFS
jgi:hypothetical protein